jgi:hypothetical protein
MCEARLKPPGDGCRKPSCSSSKKLTTLSNQASRSGGWAPSVASNWSCRSVGWVVGWVSQEVVAIVVGRSGSVSDRDGDNDGSVGWTTGTPAVTGQGRRVDAGCIKVAWLAGPGWRKCRASWRRELDWKTRGRNVGRVGIQLNGGWGEWRWREASSHSSFRGGRENGSRSKRLDSQLVWGLGRGVCSGSGRDEAAGAAQFLARLCVVPRVNLRPPALLPDNPGI